MDGTNLEEIKINQARSSYIMGGNYKVPSHSLHEINASYKTLSREFSIDLKKSRNLKSAFILGHADGNSMG